MHSAFDELLTIENPDGVLHRAVELAHDRVGLVRASIYVRGKDRHPGRDWASGTPIRCGHDVIGMMSSEGGRSHVCLDESKQLRAEMLCSMLGTALRSLAGAGNIGTVARARLPVHRLVMAVVTMLTQHPRAGTDEIARRLVITPRRLRRLFETTLRIPFGEYRNQLRLSRVALLIAQGRTTLPEAVLAGGFDSYEHFRAVFRTFRWIAFLEGSERRM
jgi:AraC-like DNA-binding protein